MLGQPASGYMTWTGQSALAVCGKIAISLAFVIGIDFLIRYRRHLNVRKAALREATG